MKKVTPSIQDYLKTLLELSENGEPVHSFQVAQAINVSRASVSRAMNVLVSLGYITKQKYGTIMLTDLGKIIAETVKKRNDLITVFLKDVLNVDADTAETDACLMEHTISEQTACKLEQYLREINDS
ncbi:MAG: metal-dependent transcriptional regulator [Christensenellales bacterium]